MKVISFFEIKSISDIRIHDHSDESYETLEGDQILMRECWSFVNGKKRRNNKNF